MFNGMLSNTFDIKPEPDSDLIIIGLLLNKGY